MRNKRKAGKSREAKKHGKAEKLGTRNPQKNKLSFFSKFPLKNITSYALGPCKVQASKAKSRSPVSWSKGSKGSVWQLQVLEFSRLHMIDHNIS
jgi:hypothetical protein